MLDILIQLLNDSKQHLYYLIRKFVNYRILIDSSIELDQERQELFKQVLRDKTRCSKDYAYCLLSFKNNNIWELLLLNDKYKLLQVIAICSEELPFLFSLDKEETYFLKDSII